MFTRRWGLKLVHLGVGNVLMGDGLYLFCCFILSNKRERERRQFEILQDEVVWAEGCP